MLARLAAWSLQYSGLPCTVFEWRSILGDAVGSMMGRWLLPNDRQPLWIRQGKNTFRLHSWEGDCVYGHDADTGKELAFPLADTVGMDLDTEAFSRDIAALLGFVATEKLPLGMNGYRLGRKKLGNKAYVAFLCFDCGNWQAVMSLGLKEGDIPLLYVLDIKMVPRELQWMVAQREGIIERLSDCFNMTSEGVSLIRSMAQSFDFKGSRIQNANMTDSWPGKRPENPTWGKVKFVFEDPDSATIHFGKFSQTLHYQEIRGFYRANGKARTPKKIWWFLCRLGAPMPYEHEAMKNDVTALRKLLKGYFGIEEDPLPVKREGGEAMLIPQFRVETAVHILKRARSEGL